MSSLHKKTSVHYGLLSLSLLWFALPLACAEETMDQMWGDSKVLAGIENTDSAALFRDGNYGMFIHWGL
jgi:alpha-L-fucosidase